MATSKKKPAKPDADAKPEGEGLGALIQIRVTDADKARFLLAAAKDNRPLSGWIRDRLLRLADAELK